MTNTSDGSCFWSRLSNLIHVRIRPAFLKCVIVRGGERGNQRTFSSAFGEFQTTRPPTVDNAGHPTKRVEHDTTQQTEMCRKYIACAENILNAMFKLGKIMLFESSK